MGHNQVTYDIILVFYHNCAPLGYGHLGVTQGDLAWQQTKRGCKEGTRRV